LKKKNPKHWYAHFISALLSSPSKRKVSLYPLVSLPSSPSSRVFLNLLDSSSLAQWFKGSSLLSRCGLLCDFCWKRKFYCSFYNFVVGSWWKIKGYFLMFDFCLGFVVVEVKVGLLCDFWWKRKFYCSFYNFL